MPYCETHNEVYRGTECPKCDPDNETTDRSSTQDKGADGIDSSVLDTESGLSVDEVEGDVVEGTQNKSIEETEKTTIDQSTTISDSVTKDTDIDGSSGSVEVEDSVMNRSDISGGRDSKTNVEDSVVNRSQISDDASVSDSVVNRSDVDGTNSNEQSRPSPKKSSEETKFCKYCGEKVPLRAAHCPSCGGELPG